MITITKETDNEDGTYSLDIEFNDESCYNMVVEKAKSQNVTVEQLLQQILIDYCKKLEK